jgi:hypothetical protein
MLLSAARVVYFFYVLAIARVIPADAQSRVGQATALPRERIVYTTLRPANWHLLLLEAGSSPQQITDDPAPDHGATFSPDGLPCWGEQRRAVFFAESSAPKE